MEDPDPLVKRDAAGSMEKWPPEEVRPALPELVWLCREDKKLSPANNSEVRRAALIVLIKAVNPDDHQYIADILVALADPDEEIRNYAALTVGNIGGDESAEATPQLLKALTQKSNLELCRQAAMALRNIGPPAKDAVPALIEALGDADASLRNNAAVALGGIGDNDGKRKNPALNAREAYLPLLKMLENTSESDQARVEAAFAMSRMGKFPAAQEAVPRLLKILGAAKQSPDVRERVVWALRVHTIDLRTMDGVIPAFSQVLTEDKTVENKMLRYDCAYMLGMLQRDKVEPLTLDTLHEFLKDTEIGVYDRKKSRVTGAGIDAPKGSGSVVELGKGDGRVMAVQALEVIGANTVRRHKGIVAELRKLANSRDTFVDLRIMCQGLLEEMNKR